MIIYPPAKYRKPSRIRSRKQPPNPTPTTLQITEIVSTYYDQPTGTLIIIIALNTTETDPILDPFESSPAKWYAWYNDEKFVGTALAMVAYNQIEIVLNYVEDEEGYSQLEYLNDPSDITDTQGRHLPACIVQI